MIIYHKGGLIPREGIKLSLASLGGVVQLGLGANYGQWVFPVSVSLKKMVHI